MKAGFSSDWPLFSVLSLQRGGLYQNQAWVKESRNFTPMKWKGLEIALNALFWVASAWLIVSGFSVQTQEFELINGVETVKVIHNQGLAIKLLLGIGLALPLFYGNLWNIGRLNVSARKIGVSSVSLLLLLVTAGLYYFLNRLPIGGMSPPLPTSLIFGTLAFYFTIATAYGLVKVLRQTEKRQQALLLGKKQAELNLLRHQLQPHFLFNALNNLLALVDQQASPLLAQSFEQLAQLLRYVIDETPSGQVTIQQEITFIRNYAALQLLRFAADEVDFVLTVTGEFDQQKLEPGLFIPFVENAFKYGTVPEQQTRIEVVFDLTQAHQLHFSCENVVYDTFPQQHGAGTGIRSVARRLALVYPNRHTLQVPPGAGKFLVDLKITTL